MFWIFKETGMQIEKAVINDRLRLLKVSLESRIPTIYNFEVIYPLKCDILLKNSLPFNSFYCIFSL